MFKKITLFTLIVLFYNCGSVDWIVEMAKKKGIQSEVNLLFHQSEFQKS